MPVVIVPALAAVAIALFALLFLFAVKLFCQAVASIIPSDIPIIGRLHSIIATLGALGSAAIEAIMGGLIRPAINLILGPVFAFLNWMRDIEHFALAVTQELNWLVLHGVTDGLRVIKTFALAGINAARHYAYGIVHALAAAVTHDLGLLKAYTIGLVHHYVLALEHGINLARAYALGLVHTLAADVVHDIALARSYAAGLTHNLAVTVTRDITAIEATVRGISATSAALVEQGVARAITVSEAYTLAQLGQAITYVDVEGTKALAAAWPGVIDNVDALVGVIGTDLPDIRVALGAIPRVLPRDLAGALTAAGALAIPAIRYMTECGVPNCRNMAQFGRELRNLLDVLEDGSLIAFLALLCTDPSGAASFVTGTLGPILDDASTAARDLLGVA